ncbi:autotransporter family protein [Bordetella sp. 02P26C-1]|uniref:autotransporter family protein n=1 Tax=Bordetella sp. 02P26C-1 TaxID=2683195 RepID=UPI0019236ADD|nr:autotransporter domain-containing protein [Bordetella sp. 02P26C-1]
MKFKLLPTFALIISAFSSTTAWSIEQRTILDKNGVPIFEMRIFDVGDGPFFAEDGEPQTSTWNLSPGQVNGVKSALDYWGELIQVAPGNNPAILNLGTVDDEGAFADSARASDRTGVGTNVNAAINNRAVGELQYGAHGFVGIGTLNWTDEPYRPSQIVLTPQLDMTTVIVHEAAHALGIGSNMVYPDDVEEDEDEGGEDDLPIIRFPKTLSVWEEHLYDDNHQRARANQVLYCEHCDNITHDEDGRPLTPADIFDVRQDKAYFAGEHVREVLAGAMPGVPLTLYGGDDFDAPIWSHLELKNSLMSHQDYRNYTNLMEAEVAVLQDLGYKIDRRNFWGYSIYGDNQTLVNDHPFFARNADGTAYLPNSYNTSTLGLGLHIYGSNNTVTQRADLLSAGAGGGGIRVDGANNRLTILPGTRVHADGAYGRAIMFAYGKGHTLTHRGDAQALGEGGIAASFDFGHNSLGDETEYRGSYIRTSDEEPVRMLAELRGPLVSKVDVTGRLAGSYASIYISENAYVGQINVMSGAQLTGDIISRYDQVDQNQAQRLTRLTFGYQADANGRSTGKADSRFAGVYDGNIVGINNLSLELMGGVTQLTGNHELYQANVAPGATLVSSGNYQLNSAGAFTNQGKLTTAQAGQSITIAGTYVQPASGELALQFNNQGQFSSLSVRGNATVDGKLSFTPERGYYADGFSLTSGQWVQADSFTGAFRTLSTNSESPTLAIQATALDANRYQVAVSRPANAYGQYASTSNERAAGSALSSVAGGAPSAVQGLITALDFSAADGSTIRSALPQLTGEIYASAKGSLINTSATTRSAVWHRLGGVTNADNSASVTGSTPSGASSMASLNSPSAGPTNDRSGAVAWGYGFGDWSNQKSNGNAARTTTNTGGFVTGIDTEVQASWRVGVLAGYSHSSIKVKDRSSSGGSDNYTLGVYSGKEWPRGADALSLRSGIAYTWHKLDMDRSVGFAGYNDKLSSDYDAGTFQIFSELGYRAHLTDAASIEPYLSLAHVNLRTDGFTEDGSNGAALKVRSDTTNTTFSTLGLRGATAFQLGTIPASARIDVGWRHAFGDTTPDSTASLAGSNAFTVSGSPIGKNTAILEAGLDFQAGKNTRLGLAYEGQFGSGLRQNAVNVNLMARF